MTTLNDPPALIPCCPHCGCTGDRTGHDDTCSHGCNGPATSPDLRDRLADVLNLHLSERDFEQGCPLACGYDGEDRDTHLAEAILTSDWFTETLRATKQAAWDESRDALGADLLKPFGPDGMRPATPNPYKTPGEAH